MNSSIICRCSKHKSLERINRKLSGSAIERLMLTLVNESRQLKEKFNILKGKNGKEKNDQR